jgi:hypothetical protein
MMGADGAGRLHGARNHPDPGLSIATRCLPMDTGSGGPKSVCSQAIRVVGFANGHSLPIVQERFLAPEARRFEGCDLGLGAGVSTPGKRLFQAVENVD